jgi:hypothetical protein
VKAHKPIRLADRACVLELEDVLLLHSGDEARIDDAVARVSRELFGIVPEDTFLYLPEDYDKLPLLERMKVDHLFETYDESFETGDDLTDDENMEVLLRLGLDFSDARGQPLRCTKLLCRVAEIAAKGIKGKLPDQTEQWADEITRSRDTFLANKRK